MQAFVLSGGFGSRLSSVIYGKPKALAPIAEKTFLEVSLHLLKRKGFDTFVLGAGYLADQIIDKFGDGSDYDLNLKYSIEFLPLGTAGSVKHAEKFFQKNFFVFDGNNFLDADFAKMLDFHKKKKAAVTIAVSKKPISLYKTKFTQKTKRVTEYGKEIKSQYVDAGYYIFNAQVLEKIPTDRKYSISADLLPTLIADNKKVVAFKTDCLFLSIRNEKLYKKTVKQFSKFLQKNAY